MLSRQEFDTIIKLTTQTFSQHPQSDMLDFLIEIREKEKQTGMRQDELMPIPEKWIQMEIVRKFDKERFRVDPRENRTVGYDFKIDDVSIELKASSSFTYEDSKPKSNRLLSEIRNHKKNPVCWMFVTVLNEAREAEMNRKLDLLGYYPKREKIPNTNPEWCVILICKKSHVES